MMRDVCDEVNICMVALLHCPEAIWVNNAFNFIFFLTFSHIFFSYLLLRYVSAKAKGRADLDWSAIGMDIAEDAGIDVTKDVARNKKDVLEGDTY